MYLGDGTISTSKRGGHRLRIFMDMAYPRLIVECATAMRAVIPFSSVHVQDNKSGSNCAEVHSYSDAWPCLLPQHGRGRKHLRPIVLADWQYAIVNDHPKAFLRGLIHSDGCDLLGIGWRQPKERTISIARRPDVELLDSFIGPKSYATGHPHSSSRS
jgi:hypothetical protein